MHDVTIIRKYFSMALGISRVIILDFSICHLILTQRNFQVLNTHLPVMYSYSGYKAETNNKL